MYKRNRESYQRNKEKVLSRQRQWRLNEKRKLAKRKLEALEYAGGAKCVKCGYDHPGALQFHHVDPQNKSFNISSKLHNVKPDWGVVRKEIDKCIVLCSNCHDLEHFKTTWSWYEEKEVKDAVRRGETFRGQKERYRG